MLGFDTTQGVTEMSCVHVYVYHFRVEFVYQAGCDIVQL